MAYQRNKKDNYLTYKPEWANYICFYNTYKQVRQHNPTTHE